MCGGCNGSNNGSIFLLIGTIFGFLFGWIPKVFGFKKTDSAYSDSMDEDVDSNQ